MPEFKNLSLIVVVVSKTSFFLTAYKRLMTDEPEQEVTLEEEDDQLIEPFDPDTVEEQETEIETEEKEKARREARVF